jgi:hypothetical protein
MKYLFLIYTDEKRAAVSAEQMNELIAAYFAYTQELKDRKVYLAGEALQPTQTATTVRVRGGKSLTTDGPFAETKEQLGGFYMVDCKDLDEALKLAAKIPDSAYGSIEVRPIASFE